MRRYMLALLLFFTVSGCSAQQESGDATPRELNGNAIDADQHQHEGDANMTMNKEFSDELKNRLPENQFKVLCEGETEPAFTGKYYSFKGEGQYVCAGCGNELFSSEHKYDSGSGWPSFWTAIGKENVKTKRDVSHGMVRDEIVCSKCGGHLGHVFEDGPRPTGLRYCVNSASLEFKAKE